MNHLVRAHLGVPVVVLLAISQPAGATIVRPDGRDVPDNLTPNFETISSVVAERYQALEDDPAPFPLGETDGFADLHVHQFSSLGFDKRVVWGAPQDNSAGWPECRETEVEFDLNPFTIPVQPGSEHGIGRWYLNGNAINTLSIWRGWDFRVGFSLIDFTAHPGRTKGYDDGSDEAFSDWPVWYTWAHQQHGIDQLARAHDDGLALMVMSAVSNRLLCLLADSDAASGYCGDDINIERQLIAAWQLAHDIDNNDGIYDRDSWYQPVVSALDANHVMAEGRMAVVLTVEGDEIFDVPLRGGWVTDTESETELDEIVNYYGLLGVRVFQPIHEFDNLAGAAAHVDKMVTAIHPYLDELPTVGGITEALATLAPIALDCAGDGECLTQLLAGELPPSSGGQEMGMTADVEQWCAERQQQQDDPTYPLPWPPLPGPPAPPPDCVGEANLKGITDYGSRLVDKLVEENLVIDLAHMSRLMQHDVLGQIPEKEPVIVSHTRYQTTRASNGFDEYSTSDVLANEIAEHGGMIGVRTIDSATNTVRVSSGVPFIDAAIVPNNCRGSSRSAAQMFLHGDLALGVKQGLGTDFNGATTQVRPRFHDPDHPAWSDDWACPNNNPTTHAVEQLVQEDPTGTDFDLVGLGHIGLEGPFLQDLRNVGYDTVGLFGSASDFVEMWDIVGTYVPDFPPEERLPRFEPSPGEDPRITHVVFCRNAECYLEIPRIPEIPDLDEWIDVLVEFNRHSTGYDPFERLGERRDEVVVAALEEGIGYDIVLDERSGQWVNSFDRLDVYTAFNEDLTLNLDNDPGTSDTRLGWPGTFNKDATLDFDSDPSTYDQPTRAWSNTYNVDETLDLDGNRTSLDTKLDRQILGRGNH